MKNDKDNRKHGKDSKREPLQGSPDARPEGGRAKGEASDVSNRSKPADRSDRNKSALPDDWNRWPAGNPDRDDA